MAQLFDRFVYRNEILSITGKSYTTIWRWCKDGHFPAPKQIGPRSIAWLASDVKAWQKRVAGQTREYPLKDNAVTGNGQST